VIDSAQDIGFTFVRISAAKQGLLNLLPQGEKLWRDQNERMLRCRRVYYIPASSRTATHSARKEKKATGSEAYD